MVARNVIVTASDSRCGDFLVDHWHRSLRENVQLEGVDIAVLDYGLTAGQRRRVLDAGMEIRSCIPDGHITNVRYRDIASLLHERAYQQVLLADGGDIIFQADISHLFETSSSHMRAVCDERKYSLHSVLPILRDFHPDERQAISGFLHDRPQINGGFVLGPADGFLGLWAEFEARAQSMSQFAADQILLNYVLHRDGFEQLPSRYNFVLVAARSKFMVRNGQFYDAAGSLIPVVHNAGHLPFFRRVSRFGYGADRNSVKVSSHLAVRALFTAVDLWGRLTGGAR
jgi:hypothetical protein